MSWRAVSETEYLCLIYKAECALFVADGISSLLENTPVQRHSFFPVQVFFTSTEQGLKIIIVMHPIYIMGELFFYLLSYCCQVYELHDFEFLLVIQISTLRWSLLISE